MEIILEVFGYKVKTVYGFDSGKTSFDLPLEYLDQVYNAYRSHINSSSSFGNINFTLQINEISGDKKIERLNVSGLGFINEYILNRDSISLSLQTT